MREGISRSHKATPNRVADFETTTDPNDCRVWAWASVNVSDIDDYRRGTDIESYIDFLSEAPTVTYFHNLAFDATFILDYIMKHGYTYVKNSPGPGEFSCLINSMGKFYSVTIVTHNGVKTELRDSLKKIPLSVEETAKAYHLDYQKLEIDYEAYRPVGYVPTEEEWEYIKHDVVIVALAMRTTLNSGMKKLTVGSDALYEYRSMTGRREFQRMFPVIDPGMDKEIRKAYRGGFTYADPRFSGRLVGPGLVFDVNSIYPYVMRERPMPSGRPIFHDGGPRAGDELFITNITFTARLKPNAIPCIQVKKSMSFKPTEYQRVIDVPVTLSCTNVDLEMWQKHYDMDILSYNGTFSFDCLHGAFNEYVDKWGNVKKASVGGMRTIAKLFLNSLYGKFATNTDVTGKYPVLEDDIVKLRLGPTEERKPVYTPVGVFITAYARQITIGAAMANYDRFAYADTDSIHLSGTNEPEGVTVDPSELGAWKQEGAFTEGVYVRAKQYSERFDDGSVSTHIAGLPKSLASQITPEDLLTDHTWHGKLLPMKVPGGTILKETTFNFKAKD